MDKKLHKLFFILRSKYGIKMVKRPSGSFLLMSSDEDLKDVAVWLLENKCGCRVVRYEGGLEVIFIQKGESS